MFRRTLEHHQGVKKAFLKIGCVGRHGGRTLGQGVYVVGQFGHQFVEGGHVSEGGGADLHRKGVMGERKNGVKGAVRYKTMNY